MAIYKGMIRGDLVLHAGDDATKVTSVGGDPLPEPEPGQ